MKVLYFCVGCSQIYYDKGFDRESGDLRIIDWKEFVKSVDEINKIIKGLSNDSKKN